MDVKDRAMSKRLPLPAALAHLLEKRVQERRLAEQGKPVTAKSPPPTKERRKSDRRRKNA
jgi:hypothetical protein